MTQMMQRMNFVMGNVCDRLDTVEKRGNEAGTSTQNVRKLGAELKANNGSFNVWEWFLHSSVLERTESDLLKINWLRGAILLNPIVLVPWGKFSLCHTPIRPISAFRDQISILIVDCVTTWSRGSHQNQQLFVWKWSFNRLKQHHNQTKPHCLCF